MEGKRDVTSEIGRQITVEKRLTFVASTLERIEWLWDYGSRVRRRARATKRGGLSGKEAGGLQLKSDSDKIV